MLAAAVLLVGSLGLATAARGVGTAWSLADTSAYVPAGPARLADTRTGAGFDRIDSRTVRVAVAGRAGVPTTAVAAVLTVTVTDTSAGGYVSVWPAGGARPTVSTLNTDSAGQTVANAVTVRLGADGAVDLYTSAVASLVVDVVGAYVPAARARAGRFVPVRPSRLADTRPWRGPLGPGERLAVPLGAGVPDDATAVVVNLTVDQSVGAGFWSAFAAAGAPPLASVLNTDGPGQTRAALTIVPLAGRAAIELFAQTGGHAIVDLVGWFTGDSATEATTGLSRSIRSSFRYRLR